MPPEVEMVLDKVWARFHEMAAKSRTDLIDEIYEMYHGGDLPAPREASSSQEALNRVIEDLSSRAAERGLMSYKYESDFVIADPAAAERDEIEQWRVYINVSARNVGPAGRFIMDRCRGWSMFKFARTPIQVDHYSDPMVVYTDSEQHAADLAEELMSISAGLKRECPGMTLRRGSGISIGQSPRDHKVSFGKLRAIAIAKAFMYLIRETTPDHGPVKPFESDEQKREYFSFLVGLAFEQIGIDPFRPHKNLNDQAMKFDLETYFRKPLMQAVYKRAGRAKPVIAAQRAGSGK